MKQMNVLQKMVKHVRRRYRAAVGDAIRRTPLLVVCTHHKTGTKWMKTVFSQISEQLELPLFIGEQQGLPDSATFFLQDHSRVDPVELPYFKGIHLIRDPRDQVVSACRYHLVSNERWLHEPKSSLDGKTYQQALRETPEDERLEFEMIRSSKEDIAAMAQWNYAQSEFMELKYEDLIKDKDLVLFEQVFRHFQFPQSQMDQCLEIAYRNSLFSGLVDDSGHVLDGRTRQWPEHFSQRDKTLFKQRYGEVLIQLGYEKDMDW